MTWRARSSKRNRSRKARKRVSKYSCLEFRKELISWFKLVGIKIAKINLKDRKELANSFFEEFKYTWSCPVHGEKCMRDKQEYVSDGIERMFNLQNHFKVRRLHNPGGGFYDSYRWRR